MWKVEGEGGSVKPQVGTQLSRVCSIADWKKALLYPGKYSVGVESCQQL